MKNTIEDNKVQKGNSARLKSGTERYKRDTVCYLDTHQGIEVDSHKYTLGKAERGETQQGTEEQHRTRIAASKARLGTGGYREAQSGAAGHSAAVET